MTTQVLLWVIVSLLWLISMGMAVVLDNQLNGLPGREKHKLYFQSLIALIIMFAFSPCILMGISYEYLLRGGAYKGNKKPTDNGAIS